MAACQRVRRSPVTAGDGRLAVSADTVRHGPGTRQRSGRRTLPTAAAFWILAVLFLMLFFASAAASPLYRLYQAQFRFSAKVCPGAPHGLAQTTAWKDEVNTDLLN